jgi:hypothetical protein
VNNKRNILIEDSLKLYHIKLEKIKERLNKYTENCRLFYNLKEDM